MLRIITVQRTFENMCNKPKQEAELTDYPLDVEETELKLLYEVSAIETIQGKTTNNSIQANPMALTVSNYHYQ